MSDQEVPTIQTEPVEQPEQEAPEIRPRARRIGLILGILAAVILLAGAAFLGARLLAGPTATNEPGNGPQMMLNEAGGKGGPVTKSMSLNIENAEEIPARTPELAGVISEIKDNSLMIGANPQMSVISERNGETETRVDFSGPVSEVVVTKETQIYKDTTFQDRTSPESMPGENEIIHQTVESISFEDLEKDSVVTVWGYKRGDRLIAEVILFSQPVMFGAPASR